MYSKASIEQEAFYWKKQIERHHVGKRVRNLARKLKYKPYKMLASSLNVKPKTIWAVANGLATASERLIKGIERLENES